MLQIIPSFLYTLKNFLCLFFFCDRVVKWVKESQNTERPICKTRSRSNLLWKVSKKKSQSLTAGAHDIKRIPFFFGAHEIRRILQKTVPWLLLLWLKHLCRSHTGPDWEMGCWKLTSCTGAALTVRKLCPLAVCDVGQCTTSAGDEPSIC